LKALIEPSTDMPISKAARSQRVRRAAEASEKHEATQRINNQKEKKKAQEKRKEIKKRQDFLRTQPIEITDDNEPIFVSDGTVAAKVFEIYDDDVALIDESHHIMAWCDDPDESGSENEESQDVVEFLWPILFGNNREPRKRKLNSGRSQYLIPMANPDSDSNKVVPRKLPRTTKHHYKMKGINAVGKNNNIMSNFLQKGKDQMKIGVEEELTESSTTTSQNHPPPSRAMDN
jgi:hypothetical protein